MGYKCYSALLNNRITNYCEMLDIFVEEQNGFRKSRSCQDHVFSLTSVIQNQLSAKKTVFAAFIDLEKAFDWVDRDLLLYRLLQYNIDGRMYMAIKSLLSQTESCIRLNGMCSEWFNVNNGVRQGDNVSPTLFSLYINELAKEINSLNLGVKHGNVNLSILLYADDMVLVAEKEDDLQHMLNKMHEWCCKWRLKVNESKSNIVHFRPCRTKQTTFTFKYGQKDLSLVNEYKYIGVILDENLTYASCSKTLADSAGRALGAVISKFKQFKEVGYHTFTKMFNTCVVPVLDYSCEIWGKNNVCHSDLIQNKACRYFLGVHNFTAIPALYGEMGWLPSKFRKYMSILRFWNRLVNMPIERLTKQVFLVDYHSAEKNWSSQVKEIFLLIDMAHIFTSLSLCDLDTCGDKLTNVAKNEWLQAVRAKPKLRTFQKYKLSCEVSNYVTLNMNRYDRSLMAKFRTGILQLRIETGRFNQTKVEDRICQLCDTSEIEDEQHFLCSCPLYNEHRQCLFASALLRCPEFSIMQVSDKFIFLMTNCDREVLKFLKKAWEVRKQILYK